MICGLLATREGWNLGFVLPLSRLLWQHEFACCYCAHIHALQGNSVPLEETGSIPKTVVARPPACDTRPDKATLVSWCQYNCISKGRCPPDLWGVPECRAGACTEAEDIMASSEILDQFFTVV